MYNQLLVILQSQRINESFGAFLLAIRSCLDVLSHLVSLQTILLYFELVCASQSFYERPRLARALDVVDRQIVARHRIIKAHTDVLPLILPSLEELLRCLGSASLGVHDPPSTVVAIKELTCLCRLQHQLSIKRSWCEPRIHCTIYIRHLAEARTQVREV